MRVIHFTRGATDPLNTLGGVDARSVDLADGAGEVRLSCLHLSAGSKLTEPRPKYDWALLVVHGGVTVEEKYGGMADLSAGMGVVVKAGEAYSIQCALEAIVLMIECERLEAMKQGISTPQRIAGQRWPGEGAPV